MKHERATLVALAYFIGITAGFIGFGLSGTESVQQVSYSGFQNTASVMTAIPQPLITTDDVILDDRGLFVVKGGEEYIVSARLPEGVAPGTGYHVSVDELSLSNDGRLLQYCVQESFDQEGCTSYVYDVANHTVRFE